MSVMLTIADYPDHPDWFEAIKKNREKFCKLDNGCIVLPKSPWPDLRPHWGRVAMILSTLEQFNRAVWVDADAVLLQPIMEADLPDTLAFADDCGGINDGITVTVKHDLPMWKIIDAVKHLYVDHLVQVQGILKDMNPVHKVLPLDIWNNRWDSEWTRSYAKIAHFPFGPDKYNLVMKVCQYAGIK
jgi:hypothetical protein